MISIIIPAYNEYKNILRFPLELLPFLRTLPEPFELITVNDGSTDNTLAACEELRKEHPNTTIVSHPCNLGLGESLKTGFANAKGDIIVTIDADLTFSPEDIPLLYKKWQETNADCVIGSHFLTASGFQDIKWHRQFLSKTLNSIYRLIFDKNITAISSIFRLYKRSAIENLILSSKGFTINAEMLFKLIKQNAAIVEVPVILSVRKFGVSKLRTFQETCNHLSLLGKILFWKITNLP